MSLAYVTGLHWLYRLFCYNDYFPSITDYQLNNRPLYIHNYSLLIIVRLGAKGLTTSQLHTQLDPFASKLKTYTPEAWIMDLV